MLLSGTGSTLSAACTAWAGSAPNSCSSTPCRRSAASAASITGRLDSTPASACRLADAASVTVVDTVARSPAVPGRSATMPAGLTAMRAWARYSGVRRKV